MYAVKEGAANGLRVDTAMVGVVGAAALTLFVWRQITLPTPLIDIRLFANRAFSGVVAANLLSVLGLSGRVFFLSQFFQLVQGYNPLRAGLAELPAAVAATVFGVLAGFAVRYWSQRGVLATGLALVGVAMASLTLISPATGYPQLGVALFVVGVGLGLAFTAASDVIIASVMPERAGAAAAISETGYELGTALGIAILGSIITAVYRGLGIPPGTPDAVASHARDSLAAATVAATSLPADKAQGLLTGPRPACTDGLAIAAGGRLGAAAGIGAGRVAAAHAPPDGTTRSPVAGGTLYRPPAGRPTPAPIGATVSATALAASALPAVRGPGTSLLPRRGRYRPRSCSGGMLCSKLNTLLGSYFALIVRNRSTLGPQ